MPNSLLTTSATAAVLLALLAAPHTSAQETEPATGTDTISSATVGADPQAAKEYQEALALAQGRRAKALTNAKRVYRSEVKSADQDFTDRVRAIRMARADSVYQADVRYNLAVVKASEQERSDRKSTKGSHRRYATALERAARARKVAVKEATLRMRPLRAKAAATRKARLGTAQESFDRKTAAADRARLIELLQAAEAAGLHRPTTPPPADTDPDTAGE